MSKAFRKWVERRAQAAKPAQEQQLLTPLLRSNKPTVRYQLDAVPRHFNPTRPGRPMPGNQP